MGLFIEINDLISFFSMYRIMCLPVYLLKFFIIQTSPPFKPVKFSGFFQIQINNISLMKIPRMRKKEKVHFH